MIRKRESDRNVLNGSSEDKRTSNKGVTTNGGSDKEECHKIQEADKTRVFLFSII